MVQIQLVVPTINYPIAAIIHSEPKRKQAVLFMLIPGLFWEFRNRRSESPFLAGFSRA